MNELILASENPGKLVEMEELLAGLNLVLLTPRSLDLHLDVGTWSHNVTSIFLVHGA